ncbi:hypothetical protein [Comamonas sp.]|uniref:hypothetical protein n=1 Tax=Comamonas sp. TaxID=34028 RepID=UPI0025847CE0|nr:hypothetical protein [Comamonas sp.]
MSAGVCNCYGYIATPSDASAYNRTELVEQRRTMLQAWVTQCLGNVLPLWEHSG